MSAVSSGTLLDTSAGSNSPPFSFSNKAIVSDHDRPVAAVRNGLGDRISARTGHGVPRFKSLPPPSFPISPPPAAALSPSSYFALPLGLSPSELLDSPVLLSSASNVVSPPPNNNSSKSQNLLSPTTGAFPIQNLNWDQKNIKSEQDIFPEFSFQAQTKPLATSCEEQKWGYKESLDPNLASSSSDKSNLEPELNSMQSNFSQDDRKKSEDGYKWRKYGQKQVKGSDSSRSYYKCTYPNCPTKKKVERSQDGQVAEIVIKGTHNHPKPQTSRRSSSSSSAASASSVVTQYESNGFEQSNQKRKSSGDTQSNEIADKSYESNGFEQSNQKRKSSGDEPDAKRWSLKGEESESEFISVKEIRTLREPRVIVQTVSDVDILDDGFRWRKYGQKVVKGNPNARSYYKCTSTGCQVRKHVERASYDVQTVITTYEGKHNHAVPPAARSSRGPYIPSDNVVRPLTLLTLSAHPQDSEIPARSYRYSSFGDLTSSCISPPQGCDIMSPSPRAKDEHSDDAFFDSFLG